MSGRGRRAGRRNKSGGLTAVEGAIVFAVGGSLAAVAIPAFVRELSASRFAEAMSGLERMSAAAVAYAQDRPVKEAFPPSAPLTPSVPPRGVREADPPGVWDHPTWRALDFRAVPEGVPHFFAFGFDSALTPTRSTFVAHAHADLDGDGTRSTFEVRGHAAEGEGAVVEPGMVVLDEVE
jgi:hypothetical protein